jgi:hypothetical protein
MSIAKQLAQSSHHAVTLGTMRPLSRPSKPELLATLLSEPQISQHTCVVQLLFGTPQAVFAVSSFHVVAFMINV